MAAAQNLIEKSDSLAELLGAQCSDLEKLLSLAKQETVAAREGKFTRIWDIVSERSAIGKRLETFHRQIAELRGTLESHGEVSGNLDITDRVVELANLTLMQDQQTRALLTTTREQTAAEIKNLERSHTGTSAYLRQPSRGLAVDNNW